MDYKYKVSVIVPVYNVELYLAKCLDSLVNQTIDKNAMEVICINDGSTDSSLEICREYEKKYPFIKVFSKENEGLSATRNYGIKRAQGKYMMYIDSDDMFTEETVERVTDYFDKVYDEVDLVTFFDQPFNDQKMMQWHFRFDKYLKADGVYDLEEYPYICQMRINVCVKNMGEDNLLFDTTPGFRQEDQEYNNRILMNKMKIGYCTGACYLYNKSNEDSIVTTTFNAINLFETSMDYFERLFSYFPDEVPRYFQAIYFHDIRWKFAAGILFPYHYSEEELDKAKARVYKLLERVDCKTILEYPFVPKQQCVYWLSKKKNSGITPCVSKKGISLLCDGKSLFAKDAMDVYYINARTTDDDKLYMRLYVAEPIYNFLKEEAQVYVCENGTEHRRLPVYPSKFGFYKCFENISDYHGFEYECDPQKVSSFYFYVKLDSFKVNVNIKFFKHARFHKAHKIFDYVEGNIYIKNRNGEFTVETLSEDEIYDIETEHATAFFKNPQAKELREKSVEYRKEHRVWLYSDLYTVKKDNAYFQFLNDFGKNDGVERYYVYTREYDEIKDLFTEEQREYLVEFGSDLHKLLFLSSELILSAFFGRGPISPFASDDEEVYYYDLEHSKVIYLQHGVLHASLLVQNSAENMRADKVVVSSYFEKENLVNKYKYRPDQIIDTGMARYDFIDKHHTAKNRILYAPSWRNYLAPNTSTSSWKLNVSKFKKSDYYINTKNFLESEKLISLLEEKDMYLELKLHPIIAGEASEIFDFATDRIVLAENDVNIGDYSMFITDFSSFVFDYAYLNRPILYFVPDIDCFKAGLGHYRELDLPFEKAFGPYAFTVQKAIDETEKIFERDFVPEDIYSERMENFYVPMDDKRCRENLYDYINDNMFKNKKTK